MNSRRKAIMSFRDRLVHEVVIKLNQKEFSGRVLTLGIERMNQIRCWLEQSEIEVWQYDGVSTFRFEHRNDALEFKLVWC